MVEYIKQEHKFNKELFDKYNLKVGSVITIKRHEEIKQITISWVNPYYWWFGNEKDGWILPRELIEINGIKVKEDIEQMMKERK